MCFSRQSSCLNPTHVRHSECLVSYMKPLHAWLTRSLMMINNKQTLIWASACLFYGLNPISLRSFSFSDIARLSVAVASHIPSNAPVFQCWHLTQCSWPPLLRRSGSRILWHLPLRSTRLRSDTQQLASYSNLPITNNNSYGFISRMIILQKMLWA